MPSSDPRPRSRGAGHNPTPRFDRLAYEPDPEAATDPDAPRLRTEFFRDRSTSVLVRNDSPDVPFDLGLNPYRGCEHGCIYCYARPTHEYLGFSAGLDFESRILSNAGVPTGVMVAPVIPGLTDHEIPPS